MVLAQEVNKPPPYKYLLTYLLVSTATKNSGKSQFNWSCRLLWLHGDHTCNYNPIIGISILGSDYDDYFSQLTLSSNKRNAWFTKCFENIYGCTVIVDCIENVSRTAFRVEGVGQGWYLTPSFTKILPPCNYSL